MNVGVGSVLPGDASITKVYTNEPLVVSTPKTFSATRKSFHCIRCLPVQRAPNLTLLILLHLERSKFRLCGAAAAVQYFPLLLITEIVISI